MIFKDDYSLFALSVTTPLAKSIFDEFIPYKWRSKQSTNLLNYSPLIKRKIKYINEIESIAFDSIYVNQANNSCYKIIYITPHLIWFEPLEGMSPLDFFYRGTIPNITKVAVIPQVKFRSYNNKSVEVISFKEEEENDRLMSNRYCTLAAFCEFNDASFSFKYTHYLDFIDRIYEFFSNHLFLPYIIHPHRLLLYSDNVIKLVSCNLLQYIFSPHASERKIKDVIFSHYNSFSNDNDDFQEKLKQDAINIILDFFHSSFVTSLWFLLVNSGHKKNLNDLYRNVTKTTTSCIKNKPKKKKKLETEIINSQLFWGNYKNDHASDILIECDNPYGFCRLFSYYNYDINMHTESNISKLIHKYGCLHLSYTLPDTLEQAIIKSNTNDSYDYLKNSITIEFELFKSFITSIFKNE